VSKIRYERDDRARHICVDQKAHDDLSSGQRVKRLLFGKLRDESQRRPNIVSGEIVLALNFLKGHAAGEASDHNRYRHTCAANHGFSVTNSWIENDAVLGLHDASDSTGFARLVEISASSGEYRGRRVQNPVSSLALPALTQV
jgi:hypothetical protein